jgi:hypothetical protein
MVLGSFLASGIAVHIKNRSGSEPAVPYRAPRLLALRRLLHQVFVPLVLRRQPSGAFGGPAAG